MIKDIFMILYNESCKQPYLNSLHIPVVIH